MNSDIFGLLETMARAKNFQNLCERFGEGWECFSNYVPSMPDQPNSVWGKDI